MNSIAIRSEEAPAVQQQFIAMRRAASKVSYLGAPV